MTAFKSQALSGIHCMHIWHMSSALSSDGHLRWCEEVIMDHSESSMKKRRTGWKKRWGFYLTHNATCRQHVYELWNRYIIISKRETVSKREQKHAGFNVPYLHGNSLPQNHLPNSCDPKRLLQQLRSRQFVPNALAPICI